MGGLVCRSRQQFHFHPISPKKQASDWLAPQEANVNNNNSLWGVIGDNGIFTLYTLNLKSCSASIEKIENGSL